MTKSIIRSYNKNTDELNSCIEKTATEVFQEEKVQQKKWITFINKLSAIYYIPENERIFLKNRYSSIYRTIPEIKPGALDLLKKCKSEGLILGLVTHAEINWSNIKIDGLNLRNYFDHIEIVDERRFKDKNDWSKTSKHLALKREQCFVVGDNVTGDIIAAHKAGFNRLIWVDVSNGLSYYRTGNLPRSALIIKKLKEIESIIFPR